MKTRNLILCAAALIALSVPAAFGQQASSSSTATTTDNPQSIAQRKDNQQDRIAEGINREAAADRQANGGNLTGADEKPINQSQNRASRSIYNKKHNGRVR